MVIEYLDMRRFINGRAQLIGSWIRKCKHYLTEDLTVPAAKCGIGVINETGVSINVGYTENGPVNVGVPLAVFEGADFEIFAQWVAGENENHYNKTAEAIQSRELKLLDSLLLKYPAEAVAILEGMPEENADVQAV